MAGVCSKHICTAWAHLESWLWNHVEEVLCSGPVRLGSYMTLGLLIEGECCVTEVARRMATSVSSMSRLTEKLVAAGLVERRVAENNRRERRLRITDAGREIYSQAHALVEARLAQLLAGTTVDMAELSSALAQVQHDVEAAAQ
ncbi:MarR family transcriptional regulator [Corynebacterium phoceense]|uniref:MarR family winged helix-turn-helix transcriptional regulator n=1 Tax=Corynebacterium phoceense TaxID=1686286 RepID=UPI0034CD0D1C